MKIVLVDKIEGGVDVDKFEKAAAKVLENEVRPQVDRYKATLARESVKKQTVPVAH